MNEMWFSIGTQHQAVRLVGMGLGARRVSARVSSPALAGGKDDHEDSGKDERKSFNECVEVKLS